MTFVVEDIPVNPLWVTRNKKRPFQLTKQHNSDHHTKYRRVQSMDRRILLETLAQDNGDHHFSPPPAAAEGVEPLDTLRESDQDRDLPDLERSIVWLPHNRTEPVRRGIPAATPQSPDYDALFDEAAETFAAL